MDDAAAIAKANYEKHFHRLASAPVLERLQHHLEHLHRQLEEAEDLGANVDKVVEGYASEDPSTNVDEKLEGHSSNLLAEVEDHAHALNLADIVHSLNQTISNIEPSQLPTGEARKIFSLVTLSLAKLDPGEAGLGTGLEVVQREDDEEKNNQHEEEVVNKVKEREHEEKVGKGEANLADGLSIFAGWPNFCKILW